MIRYKEEIGPLPFEAYKVYGPYYHSVLEIVNTHIDLSSNGKETCLISTQSRFDS